jgi:tryptophan-rich sensory protein
MVSASAIFLALAVSMGLASAQAGSYQQVYQPRFNPALFLRTDANRGW